MNNLDELVKKIDRFGSNSRANPTGYLRLNLSDPVTRKYVESGFYVDSGGYIYDTLFWPGDKVQNTKSGIAIDTETVYTVSKISPAEHYGRVRRHDLQGFQQSGSNSRVQVYKSRVHVKGISNGYSATNFVLKNTMSHNILSIDQKRPTLVRQLQESLDENNKTVYTEIGDFESFESVSAARAFVSTKIRDAVRARNEYPQYRIYTEESVALAEEPPIVFR